nr:hypothetical protein [uncultured Dongia sp.]
MGGSHLTIDASVKAMEYRDKADIVGDRDLKGQFTELSARYAELAAKHEGLPVPKAPKRPIRR